MDRGGGINNENGTLSVTHCTLASNSAVAETAIRNGGSCTLANSILFGTSYNTSTGSMVRVGANIATTLTSDINGPGLSGPAHITTNPQLAPLNAYGGPTWTMALQSGSPAHNASVGSTITSDQRGFPIVGVPDIGAYEAGTAGNFNAVAHETGQNTDPASDDDHDGINALMEYATRGVSGSSDGNPMTQPSPVTLPGDIPAVSFSFRWRPEAADLRYIVLRSGNLSGWTEIYRRDSTTGQVTHAPGVTSIATPNPGTITVTDPQFIPDATFYRLVVERP